LFRFFFCEAFYSCMCSRNKLKLTRGTFQLLQHSRQTQHATDAGMTKSARSRQRQTCASLILIASSPTMRCHLPPSTGRSLHPLMQETLFSKQTGRKHDRGLQSWKSNSKQRSGKETIKRRRKHVGFRISEDKFVTKCLDFFFAASLKRKNKRKHMSDHCNLFYCTDDEICCHRSLQIIKDVWTNNSPLWAAFVRNIMNN